MWRFSDLPSTDRTNGRTEEKFRDFLISWGSIKTANGSAIVKLGNTTVVSGITFEDIILEADDHQTIEKMEEKTLLDLNNLIDINIKFQPHCSFIFKMQGNDQDAKESLIMTTHFKQILTSAAIFDRKQLIRVEEDKKILSKMCIEILIENYDGNGFDASNIALIASMIDCKLENKKHLIIDNYPISTTFCFKRITENDTTRKEIVFQDPNLEDEKLSDGIFNIVVNADTNDLILLNKTGGEGIDLECLKKCIHIASRRANKIKSLLKSRQIKLE